MYIPQNPSFTSGLKGAVSYAEAEKQRLEREMLDKKRKKTMMYYAYAGLALVAIIYFYKQKK